MEKSPIVANFTRKNELAMDKITEEKEISDSPAVSLVKKLIRAKESIFHDTR